MDKVVAEAGFEEEQYDAVVVGAGLGGLTCGALLAKSGMKVLIIERHERPGGYCTSFQRNGFDFQVPNLAFGCAPSSSARSILDYLGVDVEFKQVDPFHRFIYPEHDLSIGSGTDSLADALKEHFIPQTADINGLFRAVENVSNTLAPNVLRKKFSFGAGRMALRLLRAKSYQDELDSRFDDERLKAILSTVWPTAGAPPWDVSDVAMLRQLSLLSEGAAVPKGGFSALADAITDAYLGFGGSMLLAHEVTSINVDGGRISGVEAHPRARASCPVVVSDSDSKRTFIKLLDRENFSAGFIDRTDAYPPSISGACLHLGIEGRPRGIGPGTIFYNPSYDTRAMYEAASRKTDYPEPGSFAWMLTVHSLVDEGLAPPGCSSLSVMVPGVPYGFKLRWGVEFGGVRGHRYNETKERYAESIVESLRLVFPELLKNVRAYDLSTPVTFERYTMALDGSWSDNAQIPVQTLFLRPGPGTAVKGLYLTGSKTVTGGGVGPTIVSGLLAADKVLKGKLKELF